MQVKTKRLETLRKHTTQPQPNPQKPQIDQTLTLIQQYFPIGSKVEVRSDEQGFRGAWFLATVIAPPLSSRQPIDNKIYVEYANLVSDENGSDLLREFVGVNFVRPKPPVDVVEQVNFHVNDVVDAYYQDGWWSGVITEVAECNSKYRVLFSDPTHELVFGPGDLRVHRSWIDGIWVLPPNNQRMNNLNFSPLTAVEVNIDTDTSHDIWFPATVVERANNHSYLVEYQSSREAGFQKVVVDPHHIRPPPPSSGIKSFSLLEKVDAFCDCRWLSGIVTKILANGRYVVYFKCIKKEKELSYEDLRLHMEWTNDKWVHSSLDTSSVTSKSDKWSVYLHDDNKDKTCAPNGDSVITKESNGHVKISPVTLRRREKALQTTGSEKVDCISMKPSNKRNKQTNIDSGAISLRASRRSNEEEAECDAKLSPETRNSNVAQIMVFDTSVDLNILAPDLQGKSSTKQSEDDNQPPDSAIIKGDYEKHPVARKSGRPRKLRVSLEELGDQTPIRSDLLKPFGPIVVGLTHNIKFMDLKATPVRRHKMKKGIVDEEQQLAASADTEGLDAIPQLVSPPLLQESELQKEGEVTMLKRKRGRPPKVLPRLGSPTKNIAELALVPECVENKRQDVNMEGATEEFSPALEVEKPTAAVEPLLISKSTPSDARTNVNIVSDQFKQMADIRRLRFGKRSTGRRQVKKNRLISIVAGVEPANTCTSRGKKLKSIKQGGLPSEGKFSDAADSSSKETVENPDNGVCRNITTVAVTSDNASDDDQPLSVWLEGAHSPPPPERGQVVETGEIQDEIEALPCGQLKKAQEENNETSVENKDDTKSQEEKPVESTAIVPRENQELPFVKNSPIWGVIESMEVFKRIPQSPHFLPLYDCKEECREGLAIGNMVTFTSLAEKISRARFDDPKSLFDGYLEALVDLEELGFNVAPVRELLHKLISIKSMYEQAQNTSKEIESQIVEREQEKLKIRDEITELENTIMELKEKQALALSKKERTDGEIALLQLRVDAVKDSLGSAQDEFEKVAATLW